MQKYALPAVITVGALAVYTTGGRKEYLLLLALIASLGLVRSINNQPGRDPR